MVNKKPSWAHPNNTVYPGNIWKGFKKATHGAGLGRCKGCNAFTICHTVSNTLRSYCKACMP